MIRTPLGRRGLMAAGASLLATPVIAQKPWPDRPIRLVVGFAPGGPTDVLARMTAQGMTETLGQPVVVENRPGANGNLGMENTVRSNDGHTFIFVNVGQIVINPHTYSTMPIDPIKDLIPVGLSITGDLMLVAHPKLKVETLPQLVALLKREPGKYSYASTGAGGITHVAMELLKQMTGTEIEAVHYRGAGPASQDMLAGTTELIIDALSLYEQPVKSGALKGIAVLSPQRSSVLPQVQTTVEAGYPDLVYPNWFGLLAPRGTPPEVVQRLNEANRAAQQKPEIRQRLIATGYIPAANSQEDFAALIQREYRAYGDIVRAKNIRAD